ncbi:MAG: LysE family translocator [Campylobacter sp.]|nr:LysE family translocator [Campylobacter sp.]
MLESFISGILLGLGAAVPIGPLNILIMSYAFHSYSKALALGLGAMATDVFYLTLLSFGVLHIFNTPTIMTVISIFGACFLTYMAVGIIRGANQEVKTQKVELGGHFRIFVKGCLINLTNPYIIVFWFSMATIVASGNNNFLITALGLIVGIVSWILSFPFLIYKSRNKLSSKFVKILSYSSAAILLFFAARLIFSIISRDIIF